MVLTGQQIATGALTVLGLSDPNGTPSDSDSQDAVNELNSMWDGWGIDEGLIYQEIALRFGLSTANQAKYSCGPGAQWDTPTAPGRVYKAHMVSVSQGAPNATSVGAAGTGYASSDTGVILGGQGQLATYTITGVSGGGVTSFTTSGGTGYQIGGAYQTQVAGAQPGIGTGFTIYITGLASVPITNRNNLDVVNSDHYYSHNDLSASASIADEVYPNYTPDLAGWINFNFYPVPNVSTLGIELNCGIPFGTWTLTGQYSVPPGFQDAIQYALAFRLLPRYGAAVAQETAQLVMGLAEKSEQRVREMVSKNRMIPEPAVAQPNPQAAPGA